jgi:hypothetical protein
MNSLLDAPGLSRIVPYRLFRSSPTSAWSTKGQDTILNGVSTSGAATPYSLKNEVRQQQFLLHCTLFLDSLYPMPRLGSGTQMIRTPASTGANGRHLQRRDKYDFGTGFAQKPMLHCSN